MSRTSTHRKATRIFFALILLLLTGISSRPVQAQISLPLPLGCGWPFETTPSTLNVMYPDANAIYWTTPYILLPGSKIEIDGAFFQARFLSIDTYNTLGNSLSALYDQQFPLDTGSQNPFSDPNAPGGNFHVTIVPKPANVSPNDPPPAGELYGPSINQFGFSQGYVIIRAYIPHPNVQQSELPNLTISLNGHKLATVPPCKVLQSSLRLLLYNALVRYWNGKITAPGQTEPTQPMFRPPPGTSANGAFPNDFNKYIVTGLTYQPGQIAVVRGLAATFPGPAPNGYPLLAGQNLRYWSMCNYDYIFPYPVVKDGCVADYQTGLDNNNYYTYVVAAPQDVPSNILNDKTVSLIPWGNTSLKKALIFRNMLPDSTFSMTTQTANTQCGSITSPTDSATCTAGYMGPYYPTVTYCKTSVYEQGGWQACFAPTAVRKQK